MSNIYKPGVSERLKEFCKILNISIIEFEKSLNFSNGYVNNISRSVGLDKLESIAKKYPKLNIEWLLLGIGSPLKDANNIIIKDIKDNSNNIKGYNNTIDQHTSNNEETNTILKSIITDKDKIIETLTRELNEKSQQITILLNIIKNNK